MQLNNINHLTAWQLLLDEAQVLAARVVATGINPDELVYLTLSELGWNAGLFKAFIT